MHKEVIPVILVFTVIQLKAQDLPLTVFIYAKRNHQSFGNDPVVLSDFKVGCVYNKERVIAFQRPFPEFFDCFVEVFTEFGDG